MVPLTGISPCNFDKFFVHLHFIQFHFVLDLKNMQIPRNVFSYIF